MGNVKMHMEERMAQWCGHCGLSFNLRVDKRPKFH